MIISATAIITYFASNAISQNKDNQIIDIKKMIFKKKQSLIENFPIIFYLIKIN